MNIDLVGIATRVNASSPSSSITRCEAFVNGLVGALSACDQPRAAAFVKALDDEFVTSAYLSLQNILGRVDANKQ